MPFSTTLKSVVVGTAAAAFTLSATATANAASSDDDLLASSIPLEYNVSTDCSLTSDFNDWAGVRSAARCSSTGNPAGEFVLFDSSTELNYRFDNVVSNSGTACPDGHGETTWFDELNPSITLGRVVCVAESDGTTAMAWTDERTMTLNYAGSEYFTSNDIYTWWKNASV